MTAGGATHRRRAPHPDDERGHEKHERRRGGEERHAKTKAAFRCRGRGRDQRRDGRRPLQRFAQALLQLTDASIAPDRIRVERPFDHAHEVLWHVRPQVTERLTTATSVRLLQLLHRRGDDRVFPGDEVEEHDADAIEIALDRRLLTAEDLGRQIERCPDETAGTGERLAGPEVHEDDAAPGLAHDVLSLDVAVQQPGAVNRRERGADVQSDECRLAGTELAAIGDELLERLASNELGPETDATVVLLGAVDLHDVLVAEPGQTSGLLHHPSLRVTCVGPGLVDMKQLQRDVAVELGVPRAKDVARGALADELEEDETAPSPALRSGRDSGRGLVVGRRNAAVEGSDALDEAEMSNDAALAGRSAGLNRLPIDRVAVRHRCSEIRERAIVGPQRAGPLRVGSIVEMQAVYRHVTTGSRFKTVRTGSGRFKGSDGSEVQGSLESGIASQLRVRPLWEGSPCGPSWGPSYACGIQN